MLAFMSWLRDRRVALAAVTFFTLLAGDAWRYSVSWYGWGAVIVLIVAGWAAVAVHGRVDLRRIPIALGALALLMAASILWSAYPGASALGVTGTVATMLVGVIMAHTLDLPELLRALGVALRWILGLSLAFELFVAAVLQRPVLPLWVEYEEPFPRAFYWSRALLFEGGRIQGIPGNANLLAFAALLAVIVFGIQLAERRVGAAAGWGWLGAAVLTLALTRSSTVLVCGLAAAAMLGVVLLARRLTLRGQYVLAGVTALAIGAAAAGAVAAREPLLALLGRSEDLTGRLDIWAAVIGLAQERPVLGWGWVSYWAPWVEPFDDLVVINGVTYLQAHNAWLDVWLQLGVVGLIVFGALVVTTAARTLGWTIDGPRSTEETPALRLLPTLVLTVLLVHSLAESRLLIEAGLVLLTWLAVASRRHAPPRRGPASVDAAKAP